MRTVATINSKGGSGKSTLALHLAVAAQQQGLDTVIVDCDPQATCARWAQRRAADVPVVVQAAPSGINAQIERAAGAGAGLVVIDTPPRAWVGADQAARTAASVADLVLVPARPSIADLESTADTLERIAGVAPGRVLVVLTACPARGRDPADAAAVLAGRGADVCPVRLVSRVAYARALIDGRTAQEVEPGGRAAAELASLYAVTVATLQGGE